MLFINRLPAVGNHTGSRRIQGVEMKRIRVRVLGGAVALLLASVALTQQPVPRPVATVTQLMQAMMVPASNALFNVPRQVPEDDAGWDALRNHAVIIAVMGHSSPPEAVTAAASRGLAAGDARLEPSPDPMLFMAMLAGIDNLVTDFHDGLDIAS